jgi:hypothetical protein
VIWTQTQQGSWSDGTQTYTQWEVTLNVGVESLYATQFSVVPPAPNTIQVRGDGEEGEERERREGGREGGEGRREGGREERRREEREGERGERGVYFFSFLFFLCLFIYLL